MATIIRFDSTRKKPQAHHPEKSKGCSHRQVIAYTVYRTVNCAVCGKELDAFDVLVDMLKAYPPPDAGDSDEKRLQREMEKRSRESSAKDPSTGD